MKNKLLVVGNCYMETVVYVDAIPTADVTVSDNNSCTRRPGGRGGCFAVAASRLGTEVSLCSSLGKDSDGKRLLDYYNENGIDTSFVRTDRRNTGVSIHLHETAFNTDRKILCNGANTSLTIDNIVHALESEPNAVLYSVELPMDLLEDATHSARIHGLPVFLDASGVKPMSSYLRLEGLELFITDIAGVHTITGMKVNTAEKCLPAAIALANRVKSKYYLLKLGPLGTFIYDGKFQHHVIPCQLEGESAGAPIDTEAAVISAAYLTSHDIKNSCALAAVMAKMSREDPKVKMPTMAQAIDYCKTNHIKL